MNRKTRSRLNGSLIALVALALCGVIASSVMAGPQTIPRAKDIDNTNRTVVPESGGDERASLPKGDWVAGNGVIEPHQRETKVAGEVGGRVAVVRVEEGAFVAAGQVLVELESSTAVAALHASEADLESTKAEMLRTTRGMRREEVEAVTADTESLRARADLSSASKQRIEQLAKTGAATPDELDRAERQAESDKSSFDAAEARRRAAVAGSRAEDIAMARARQLAAAARVAEAKARLDQLSIRAPYAGEVLQVKFRAGEYYQPGGDPLIVLGDTRTLRARIDVDERDVLRVKVGAESFVMFNAYPGHRIPARVVEMGRRMGRKNVRTDDPVERIDTKILEVVVELKEKAGLVPGLRVVGYIARS